jgi:membrane protein DedA with SNARE-associated domain
MHHVDFASILLSQELEDYFRSYGYIGIYVWYVTIDQIGPIPEEVSLIVIGYFAAQGLFNPFLTAAFSIAAFITIDTIYFFLTKSGNKLIKKLRHKSTGPKATAIKQKLKKHTLKTLIVLCFIPRMRLLAPVFVSLMKFPYRKFVVFDLVGLSIFTAVYISLGFVFHSSLSSLVDNAKTLGTIIFIAAMVLMTVLSIIIVKKMNKKSA